MRETATARLRMNPNFIEALAADLNSRGPSTALGLVESTTFSPDELAKLALPTRNAIKRFIAGIPAPNYTTPERRKQLRAWGRKTFAAIAKKFASTDVDFAPTLAAFERAFVQEKRR